MSNSIQVMTFLCLILSSSIFFEGMIFVFLTMRIVGQGSLFFLEMYKDEYENDDCKDAKTYDCSDEIGTFPPLS
jgi:hypothetical protein